MSRAEPTLFDHPAGITAVDTEFADTPMLAASHLVVDGGEAAVVDVGSNFSTARILRALELKGVARSQVRYVCVTHVHLDHAGGAGELMRQLPQATLVVHPRGRRHMIDPSALYAGAKAVYGEQIMARHYGQLEPVPESRVRVVEDGERLPLGARQLRFLHTPGHAEHHYCIVDEQAHVVFSGDAFGVSYRCLDSRRGAFILPSTSPVQFDPEAAHRSIERLRALAPQAIYLTHFSRVTEIPRLADDLHRDIDAHVAIALRHADAGAAQGQRIAADLSDWFHRRLCEHGTMLSAAEAQRALALDIALNTQGLQVWLRRRQRAQDREA